MRKRLATRLGITWPASQVVRSLFDGKKLPKAKELGRLVLPAFPELLDKIAVNWKTKPYSEKHPLAGASLLDWEQMMGHGILQSPPIEPLVEIHLHPQFPLSSSAASLPTKMDRFQSNFTEKCHNAAALSVRALNASSIFRAYQASSEEDLTAKPVNTLWEEICSHGPKSVIGDPSYRESHGPHGSLGENALAWAHRPDN